MNEPEVFDSAEALASRLKKDLGGGPWIVGIDGIDGIGKSPLTRELAPMLGAVAVHLDEHVEKDRGNYVDFLRIDDVKRILEENDKMILDGVCMLAAAKRLGVTLDRHVYIKRMKYYGYPDDKPEVWRDREECNPPEDIDDFLAKKAAEVKAFSKFLVHFKGRDEVGETEDGLGSLREEIIRYHGEYGPHQAADAIFHRYEDE